MLIANVSKINYVTGLLCGKRIRYWFVNFEPVRENMCFDNCLILSQFETPPALILNLSKTHPKSTQNPSRTYPKSIQTSSRQNPKSTQNLSEKHDV